MASNFTHAIVRRPCRRVIEGITTNPQLGTPDYELALRQHDDYVGALQQAGVEVTVLPALDDYPDSVFVEDTCVITPRGVVVDIPATPSRHDEAELMLPTLREFFAADQIKRLVDPATLEGGDVMMVDDTYYVGHSRRTNQAGFDQFTTLLAEWGYATVQVPVEHILHLKTGGTYVEDGNLLVSGEFKASAVYRQGQFANIFEVPDGEAYGADCVRINDKVIMAAGYPVVEAQLRAWGAACGYGGITVDMREDRKIDGWNTCLSVRW